jgi:plastocyanin
MKQSYSILIGLIIIAAVVFVALQYRNTDDEEALDLSTSPTASPLSQSEFVGIAPSTTPVVSPSPAAVTNSMSVSIDDEGFTPASITIPKGTTVVFTNNGQGSHWPASDPHPTHNGLPGFDAKQPLTTGETYSFTFDKVGTFGVHDHLNASLKGTIIVQ